MLVALAIPARAQVINYSFPGGNTAIPDGVSSDLVDARSINDAPGVTIAVLSGCAGGADWFCVLPAHKGRDSQ